METATKRGYKMTELGLIPSDWEVITLGEVGEVKMCRRIFNNETAPFGEIPFFKIGTFGKEPDAFISKKIFEDYKRRFAFPQKGDILISAAGTIGRTIIFNGEDAYFQDSNIVWIENNTRFVSNNLLYYLFKIVNYNTEGGTIQRLYNGIIRKAKIPLPPLPEQTAIAKVLKDTDDLIQSLEKLIAKKKLIKQGAMQDLLNPIDKDGKPKEGWVKRTLYELADNKRELFNDGDWIETEHLTNEGIRLIQTGNIGIGNFIEKANKKYINPDSFARLNCKELFEGDLLICRLADPAGRSCILPNIGENKVVTSVDVTIFRPNKKVANRIFLSNLFSTDNWFKMVNEMVGGTTHKRISRSSLGKIKILIPPILAQNEIADALGGIDYELICLENILNKYQTIKQGMIQQLLTGKIRIFNSQFENE